MTLDHFDIKSSSTDTVLRLLGRNGDYFTVAIQGTAVSAARVVWGYTDCDLLVQLFQSMARDWRGWTDARKWDSIAGEFALSCTCDRAGHVRLGVTLHVADAAERWRVEYTLTVEAGQLQALAAGIAAFFKYE
jgi:Family of unknown function (DUF6228)